MNHLISKARAYHTAVSEHDVDLVRAMIRPDYIQHNPRVPTGSEPFLALLQKLKEHNTRIQNVRIFQDGRHVIMHHLWKNAAPFGSEEKVAFHIIRFDDADLVAEHWSVMTDYTAENLSQRTLIDGERQVGESRETRSNKSRVVELYRSLIRAERMDDITIFKDFFVPDYKQHHPKVADGIVGFADAVKNGILDLKFSRQHKVFGSGNFVLSISEGTEHGVPTVFYDLFRIEDGFIAEHWTVYQEIPLVGLANDNTMFNFDPTELT